MIFLGLLCASYLLGGIPTGLLLGRWVKGIDIRQYGSGNVGATNVLRVVGKVPGLLVLVVDLFKGWLPVALFPSFALPSGTKVPPELLKILFGMAAVSGHLWNPFLELKGGRGVATSLGVLLGLNPKVALGTFMVWVGVLLFTRYVSVASLSAALIAPFLMFLFGSPLSWLLGSIGVSLAVIARHRPNILRLIQGEEHRFGSSPKN